MKELIVNGADIDCMNDKEATPLYLAAQNNSIGVAEVRPCDMENVTTSL